MVALDSALGAHPPNLSYKCVRRWGGARAGGGGAGWGGKDKAQGKGQAEVGMKQGPEGGGFAGQAQFRSHSVDIREPVKDFKLGNK